jgi:predicted MFS family arabinose efflux permease
MILSFSASALYIGIGLGAIVGGGVISVGSIDYVGIGSGILVILAFILFVFVNRVVERKTVEKVDTYF